MARDLMRFPFAGVDHAGLVVTSATDEPFAAQPGDDDPYPQSLRIDFTAPAPPRAVPLFPGLLGFTPLDGGTLVDPATIDLDHGYPTWPTRGWLWVVQKRVATARALRPQFAGLDVLPNRMWIGPVDLTEAFLLDTLLVRLPKSEVTLGSVVTRPAVNPSAWRTAAVAGFLAGRYRPALRAHATDPTQDDAVAHPMPVVPVDAGSGAGVVWVATARTSRAQDAYHRSLETTPTFDDHTGGAHPDLPAHPQHGAVPARAVYRSVRPRLIDGGVGVPAADAVVGAAPLYRALRFTRSWRPVDDTSVHFPGQVVRVERPDGSQYAQRLASHGVVFHPVDGPAGETLDVVVTGSMLALNGATAEAWRAPAGGAPVTLTPAQHHVILRRPLREALLSEEAWTPGGARCTYLTIRRFCRAVVDNQITGGRLNVGVRSSSVTTKLLGDAWSGSLPAATVTGNRPKPDQDLTAAGTALRKVLSVLFPDLSPGTAPDGSAPAQPVASGEVAYYLWQSAGAKFRHATERYNYPVEHIGRGGAGALAFLGLADEAFDPRPLAGDATPEARFTRVADAMTTDLVFPAVAQFWYEADGFDTFVDQNHSVPEGHTPGGHSLLLLGYDTDAAGQVQRIRMVDQFGTGTLKVVQSPTGRRVRWWGNQPEIWVAANVEEQ